MGKMVKKGGIRKLLKEYGMFPRDYGYGQMGSRTFKGLDNGGFGHLGILLGHN